MAHWVLAAIAAGAIIAGYYIYTKIKSAEAKLGAFFTSPFKALGTAESQLAGATSATGKALSGATTASVKALSGATSATGNVIGGAAKATGTTLANAASATGKDAYSVVTQPFVQLSRLKL